MRKGLIFTIILFITFSCDHLNKKEQASEVLPSMEVPPSYLSFRVNFPSSELEAGLNRILPQQLLDDALPLKDKNDKLFLKLSRKGDLKLAVTDGVLKATIPLDVSVSVKKKVLGITFSNEDAPVHLSGTVKASAEMRLRDDWEFDVICQWEGFDWSDQPTISLGGYSMDIGDNVDRFLDDHSDLLSDVICNAIHKSLSFRKILTKVWMDIQDPIRIKTPDQDLWLHCQPIALSGVAVRKEDTLSINLEYRSALNLSLQSVPFDKKSLPDNSAGLNDKPAFLAYPEVFLSYELLQQSLQKQLIGQQVSYEDYTSTIKSVFVGPAGQKLQVRLGLEGDIEGILMLNGTPHLNENMELSLQDFEYDLEASDEWVAFTELAMHSFVEEYVSSFLNVDLKPLAGELDQTVIQGVNNSPLGEKLSMQLDLKRLESYQLRMTEQGLQWIFFMEGRAALNLKEGLFEKK